MKIGSLKQVFEAVLTLVHEAKAQPWGDRPGEEVRMDPHRAIFRFFCGSVEPKYKIDTPVSSTHSGSKVFLLCLYLPIVTTHVIMGVNELCDRC